MKLEFPKPLAGLIAWGSHTHTTIHLLTEVAAPLYLFMGDLQNKTKNTNLKLFLKRSPPQGRGPYSHSWATYYCLCGWWHPRVLASGRLPAFLLPKLHCDLWLWKGFRSLSSLWLHSVTLQPHFTKSVLSQSLQPGALSIFTEASA